MPQFRFVCTRCDHEFSEMLWPTEPISAVRCPECGAGDAEKQLAPFAVRSSSRAATRSEEPPLERALRSEPAAVQRVSPR